VIPIPRQVGPCRFGRLGAWITVQFDTLVRNAGGTWDRGARRRLLRQHRLGPVLCALCRRTDPLFRQAGLDLDR
jgi:hypothetical protein